MANNNTIKLTESDLKYIIETSVKRVLMNEGFLDKVSNKLNQWGEKLSDKADDFERGYDLKEGKPQSIEDVFEGDGWKIKAVKQSNNGYTYYGVIRVAGTWGVHNGIPVEEMAEELNIFLQDSGKEPSAVYVGKHPNSKQVEVFKVKTI